MLGELRPRSKISWEKRKGKERCQFPNVCSQFINSRNDVCVSVLRALGDKALWLHLKGLPFVTASSGFSFAVFWNALKIPFTNLLCHKSVPPLHVCVCVCEHTHTQSIEFSARSHPHYGDPTLASQRTSKC